MSISPRQCVTSRLVRPSLSALSLLTVVMLTLLNALPNAFMPTAGQSLVIQGVTEQYATDLLQGEFESFVGHESFAQVLSKRTGISIPVHRGQAPSPMDAFGAKALVAMVQPPRRLGEGEAWTEAEILAMPITWVLVKSATTDQAERAEQDAYLPKAQAA